MEKEILDILKGMQNDMKSMQNDMKSMQNDIKSMNERLIGLETGQQRIEKKLDSVYEQTADLTEFRTETKQGIDNIQKDLNTMELVTSKNWNDIAQLKAIK